MLSECLVLFSCEIDRIDQNLVRLLDFWGIKNRVIQIENSITEPKILDLQSTDQKPCVFMNVRTLGVLLQTLGGGAALREYFSNNLSNLLVYNVSAGVEDTSVIQSLTGGAIQSILVFADNNFNYKITDKYKNFCGQFSGLDFGPIKRDFDLGFGTSAINHDFRNIITIDGHPFFMEMKIGDCTTYLLASREIIDIRQKINDKNYVQELFSRIVPEMMLIKHLFDGQCWHNHFKFASLVIDDPLLIKKYGFLDYRKLLFEMDKHGFSSSVACIPWNYHRTSQEVAKLFRTRSDRMSICVHGCDHTNNEFGSEDAEELNKIIHLAEVRMKEHEAITGLKCDRVMVFPQGKFSSTAMKLLKANNFLAAVNTEMISVDKSDGIEISMLLEPAIMEYQSFPLFLRRYPGTLVDFAFDLFVGKPILMVIHLSFLKDGYQNLTNFIEEINQLDKNIHWTGLEQIIEETHLEKEREGQIVQLKLFSKRSVIENSTADPIQYQASKREANDVSLVGVEINGEKVVYKVENELVQLSFSLEPNTKAEIEFIYADDFPYQAGRPQMGTLLKVSLRRYLSEIRDNYLKREINNIWFSDIFNKKK